MTASARGPFHGSACRCRALAAAPKAAIAFRRPRPGTVFHSDRGSVHASKSHRKILKRHGFTASMGRRGNPYDNVAAESLMKTLKVEAVHVAGYETFEDEARRDMGAPTPMSHP